MLSTLKNTTSAKRKRGTRDTRGTRGTRGAVSKKARGVPSTSHVRWNDRRGYVAGDAVDVRWSDNKYYAGTVVSVRGSHATVAFPDGDSDGIPFSRMRRARAPPSVSKWRALPARDGNTKDMINDYLLTLVKPSDHVFTLEDPSKWRTTRRLLAHGVRVTALSLDAGILSPPDPSVTVVHDYTTPYLRTVGSDAGDAGDAGVDRPSLCWLDYCASVRRSNSGFDWVEDLSLALRWSTGPVVLTFSKRGVANYLSFALHQIATVSGAHVLDVFEYQGENNAAMCALTVTKSTKVPLTVPQTLSQTLSHYATPHPGETVRVDQGGYVWEGELVRAYTPLEWEVRDEAGQIFMVYAKEVTHVKM